MEVEPESPPCLQRQLLHRLEQDVNALVGVDLAEEAELRPAGVASEVPRGRRLHRLLAVLQHHDPVFRQPPADVALAQELARRDEQVDELEVGLDEELAQEEVGGRVLREAPVALVGGGSVAELERAGLDHLAVVVAERPVVVQGYHEAGVGVGALDLAQQLDAEVQVVMEVDDIRLKVAQKVPEGAPDDVLVRLREAEVVRHLGVPDDLAGTRCERRRGCRRGRLPPPRVRGSTRRCPGVSRAP